MTHEQEENLPGGIKDHHQLVTGFDGTVFSGRTKGNKAT
jgi:hypothetical protein